MHNPRIYHLRDGHNRVLAKAEVTFDLQQNMHYMEVENLKTKKSVFFEYENPNDSVRYLKLAAIDLNLQGFDHFIEEAMPV